MSFLSGVALALTNHFNAFLHMKYMSNRFPTITSDAGSHKNNHPSLSGAKKEGKKVRKHCLQEVVLLDCVVFTSDILLLCCAIEVLMFPFILDIFPASVVIDCISESLELI